MTFNYVCTYEGGTLTVAPTTADTGNGDTPNSIVTQTGATATYDGTNPAFGTKGIKIVTTSSAKYKLGKTSLATTTDYPGIYVRLNGGFPATTLTILQGVQSGGTATSYDVQILTTGKVQVRDSAANILGTSTATVPTAAQFRIETDVDVTAKTLSMRFFSAANLNTTTADYTLGPYTLVSLGSSIDSSYAGNCTQNNPGTFWIDHHYRRNAAGAVALTGAETSTAPTTPPVDTNTITVQWNTCINGAWVADSVTASA